jgi:mRNA interferase RelE/StbE
VAFTLSYSEKSVKQMSKMDKGIARLLHAWLSKNIDGCTDPRASGKALVGSKRDYWRYRIGDYRVICDIQDKQLTVLVIEVGHRKSIYKSASTG